MFFSIVYCKSYLLSHSYLQLPIVTSVSMSTDIDYKLNYFTFEVKVVGQFLAMAPSVTAFPVTNGKMRVVTRKKIEIKPDRCDFEHLEIRIICKLCSAPGKGMIRPS